MAAFYPYKDKKDKRAEAKESEQKSEQEAEEEEEEKGTATRATTRSASRLEAERWFKESNTPRLKCHLKSSAHLVASFKPFFFFCLLVRKLKESGDFNPKSLLDRFSRSWENGAE